MKGVIFVDNSVDAERLMTILTNNGYKVKAEKLNSIDWLYAEYKLTYKKKEEDGAY